MKQPIVSEIERLHGEIQASLRHSLDNAVRIGELLTRQKAALDHGDWGDWLDANIVGEKFSRSNASHYMKLYKEREQLKILNVRNIGSALRMVYGKTKKQKSRRNGKKKSAEPYPTDVPQFRPRQKKEFKELFEFLAEKAFKVFHSESLEVTVLKSLRFAKKNWESINSDELRPATIGECLGEQLGEDKWREISRQRTLYDPNSRDGAGDGPQEGWDVAV